MDYARSLWINGYSLYVCSGKLDMVLEERGALVGASATVRQKVSAHTF